MKQIIYITLGLLLACIILLTDCTKTKNKAEDGKLAIIATIFPPYDFIREIAGDNVNVRMLLSPGSESHSFEPTPKDVAEIQNCDVFIYAGGESDAWVNKILSSLDTSKMTIITLVTCVKAVKEEIVEGMQDDAEEEHNHGKDKNPEYDEHVWTSPKNAKLIVQKISDTLCKNDSANAGLYKKNTAAYLAKLDELDSKFQDTVNKAVRKTIVFGDRFPFRYFADAYKLRYFAAFPGCSTETEASAATVKFLIDKIKAEKIPVIFHAELSNQKMANAISEATGAKVRLLHAAHNISKDDFKKGLSYLDIMNRNVSALKEALE